MKTARIDLIGLSLALSGALFLSNCVQKGNDRPKAEPAVAANPAGTQAPAANNGGNFPGTSDSGGGTGLDGKVFESYRVDPTQLPAYKEHVKPVLRAILSPEGSTGDGFEFFFALKTWYIAPVDLEKVGTDSLGVSFFRTPTDQIARQTMREVWITKSKFDAMNLREQGDIIMHEFVMTLYFMQFMPMSELCKYSAAKPDDKSDSCHSDNKELFAEALKPVPARALTAADNENIRYVTAFLLNKGLKTMREDEFSRLLVNHGFDKRFFGPNQSQVGAPERKKVTGKELSGAIRGAALAGRMPTHCMAQELMQTKECRVSWSSTRATMPGTAMPLQALIISLPGSDDKIVLHFNLAEEIELSASESADFGVQYQYVQPNIEQKVSLGTRLHTAVFTFKFGPEGRYAGLILDSIIIRPGVVVDIDKKRDPICRMLSPKPQAFLEDTLAITTGRNDLSVQERLFTKMPPMGLCYDYNLTVETP